MAINNATLGVFYPIGAILQGSLGDRFGIRQVTVTSGVVLAAVMAATWLLRPGFTSVIVVPQDDLAAATATV